VSQHRIDMLRSSIVRVVDFSIRHGFWVIALALSSAVYAMRHFAIKTDVTDLLPPDLPWTRRALDFMQAYSNPANWSSSMLRHPNSQKKHPANSPIL
jgi:predicted RND superfamily exporter protein